MHVSILVLMDSRIKIVTMAPYKVRGYGGFNPCFNG